MSEKWIKEEIDKIEQELNNSVSSYYNDAYQDKYIFKPIPGLELNVLDDIEYFKNKNKDNA